MDVFCFKKSRYFREIETHPDTSSFGISEPNVSAISLLPMLAMHCNARLT